MDEKELNRLIENFKKEKLYHFTTFESACKILTTNELRFGELKNMNDISEAHKQAELPPAGFLDVFGGFEHLLKRLKLEFEVKNKVKNKIEKLQQLSLSYDTDNCKMYDCLPMWGMYAKNATGVCIVFEKDAIESKIENLKVNGQKILYDYVCYDQVGSIPIPENIDFRRKKDIKRLFFRKTKEWGFEQEFRMLARSDNKKIVKLNIEGAICAIIIFNYNNLPNIYGGVEYKMLQKITKVPILEYKMAREHNNTSVSAPRLFTICSNGMAVDILPLMAMDV